MPHPTLTPLDALRPHFEAILAAPDDDGPRLRLAEALEAAGDPRAESIRLGCRLERLEHDDPQRAELAKQCAALPRFSYFTDAPRWHRGFKWRRGFVDEVEWSVEHFVEHGQALVRAAPVRTLAILGSLAGRGAALAGCEALSALRALRLTPPPTTTHDLLAIGASPHAAGLAELHLESALFRGEDARALWRDGVFPGLRRLTLRRCSLQEDADEALLAFAGRRALARLDLDASGVSLRVRDALAALPGDVLQPRPFVRATTPAALRARTRFGTLGLAADAPSAELWTRFLDGGPYPEVRTLYLTGAMGDVACVRALARSRALPALERLFGVPLAAIGALCEAEGLEALQGVWLDDEVASGPDGGLGPTDGAVRALALAARLPGLREVHASHTWRDAEEGSREETLTVPLSRADGAEVRVIISHQLWP